MKAAWTAFRLQLRLAWRTPNYWMAQLTTPPTVVIFMSVTDAYDRPDLMSAALVAPILITMWGTTNWTGGSVVRDDRWQGRLELHAAAPTSYGEVVFARVAAVVLLSLLSVPIALVTAWAGYGYRAAVHHPGVLAAVLGLTTIGLTAAGVVFSSLSILTRAALTFQSAASYPFLLISGVFVPLALLPVWVRPLGWLMFLSWSADLVRDSVTGSGLSAVPARLAAVAGLGAATAVLGVALTRVVLTRVRRSGEIGAQ